MAENKKILKIEVAYANFEKQFVVNLEMEEGSTILDAISRSKIGISFPEIALTQQKVGIFGKVRKLSDLLKDNDRVEIYRPLLIDPKIARLTKAKNNGN